MRVGLWLAWWLAVALGPLSCTRFGTTYNAVYIDCIQNANDDPEIAAAYELANVGSKCARQGLWARRLPAGDTLELELDPAFAASLAGSRATLRITHLQTGGAELELQAWGQSETITVNSGGSWRTAELPLQSDGTPRIALRASGGNVTLHMVEVRRP